MAVGVVVRAAAVILAVLVPPVVVVRVLQGGSVEALLWYVVVAAYVVSFLAGGLVAGRLAPGAPVKHAAAAGIAAFGVALAYGIARNLATGRSMSAGALVTGLLLWQIAASLSMLGGALGGWRARRVTRRVTP